jgi:hypothetical protein
MQHARIRLFADKAQVRRAQRLAALTRERGRPRDARAASLRIALRTPARPLQPSKTAARVSGGAFPMAQRFFDDRGMTPFT